MSRIRVFFYVQHLLGIGHLTRASRIAQALQEDGMTVTLVTGGAPVAGFPGPGLDHVALPVLAAGSEGFSALVDDHGNPASDDYKARRRALLLEAYARCRPDIVMIEAFPFGRRQMRFELLPLLERIKGSKPRPLTVVSVRDILQARTKPGRDAEAVALVKAHFDAVLVHGDPGFARLEQSFALAHEIEDRVFYTGVVAPAALEPSTDRFDIVVSAGGGAVGQAVTRAAVGAAARMPSALTWLVLSGPNLPEADHAALLSMAPANVTVARFRRDFGGLLAKARLSISQAGYNTVGDILLAGCRSILVPFEAGGETEQADRAARLQAMGRALVVEEAGLTPETLARTVERALALPDPAGIALDTGGAKGTAAVLRTLLRERAVPGDAGNRNG